jgi:hypothetical protein
MSEMKTEEIAGKPTFTVDLGGLTKMRRARGI